MTPLSRTAGKLAAFALALLLLVFSWLPTMQQRADELTDEGLKRALVTFAVARTLNAAISVVQGTELSVQPLGLGVTLKVGEVLDPVNDLVEQFSSLMLFASVAFGVQKMLLSMTGAWAVSALVSAIALIWAGLIAAGHAPPWFTRVFIVVFLVRFAVPIATVGSGVLFEQLLAGQYTDNQSSLVKATASVEAVSPDTTKSRSLPDLDSIKTAVASLPERIVTLIAVFLMQTVALPILLLWGVYRLSFAGVGRVAPPADT